MEMPKKLIGSIDERGFDTLTNEEKDAKYMLFFGEHYTPPTKEERNAIRKKYGFPPID